MHGAGIRPAAEPLAGSATTFRWVPSGFLRLSPWRAQLRGFIRMTLLLSPWRAQLRGFIRMTLLLSPWRAQLRGFIRMTLLLSPWRAQLRVRFLTRI